MAVPSGVDPYEVLGVASGAAPSEVAAAYRRLAKRWHPDRAPAAGAADRMALINAAYDELRGDAGTGAVRAGAAPDGRPSAGPRRTADPAAGTPWGRGAPSPPRAADDPLASRGPAGPATGPAPRTAGAGGWAAGLFAGASPEVDPEPDGLTPALRAALGLELRTALRPGEEVRLVVPASTWASPQTTLAITDRRLLWLLDDAPVHRVRTLQRAEVADVRVRPPRPWRPAAQVVVTDRRRRRTTFGDLPPETAAAVARRVPTAQRTP